MMHFAPALRCQLLHISLDEFSRYYDRKSLANERTAFENCRDADLDVLKETFMVLLCAAQSSYSS
jgi:hypothetical protein